MVLAAKDMKILEDGTLQLKPFAMAVFGKDRGDPEHRQIDTVTCQTTVLRFDQPVKNIVEMSNRKIVGFTMSEDIQLVDNRRTPDRSDDISVYTQGPLEYEESRHSIWTQAEVRLTDPSSKPQPNTIVGKGMDIFLTPEASLSNSGPASAPKTRNDATGPVERIVIRSDVDMNLWVDARSGFLGTDNEKTKTSRPRSSASQLGKPARPMTSAPAQAEKAKVTILTQGPFTYDLQKNRAIFHISEIAGPKLNVVTVDRYNIAEGKIDHLQCDHLEIQFKRKQEGPAAASEQGEGLDIEDAHATGKEVMITSDAEILEAHGNDFFYDKLHELSILKGAPKVWVLKEGNLIEAPELHLQSAKDAPQATAVGEGRMSMLDKKTGKRPLAARWSEKLVYKKEGSKDVLELVGNAAFFDQGDEEAAAPRTLQANVLKVWLLPAEAGAPATEADEQQRRKPDHLDAAGRVSMSAPDMSVHDTEHLTVWFKDVPPVQLPVQADPANNHSPGAAPSNPGGGQPAEPGQSGGQAHSSMPGPEDRNGQPARKPIDLVARQIVAHVQRTQARYDLEKLWCEGAVHVHQEPSEPGDKGVDIVGDTLQLDHHVDGNILAVTSNTSNSGSTDKYARVQMNKISILGAEVNIDQTSNVVQVNGTGIMNMQNKKDFNGADLAKPTDLTIYWRKRMYFNGQEAQFWEGVLAEQEGGHLGCEWMQVFLDRMISLREGEKNGGSAKVQKLVCGERKVWLEDTKQEGSRIVSARRLDASFLSVDNDTDDSSQGEATGPGSVRIFQLGAKGDPLNNPSPSSSRPRNSKPSTRVGDKKDDKSEMERKLTQIYFGGRMSTNNRRNIVTFYDNVAAVHFATEDPDYRLSPGRLPPGGVAITCGKLELYSHKHSDDSTTKEMRAYHNVVVEGEGFSGRGDIVKYDESKEQIIFEGLNSPAVLYRRKASGVEPDKVVGSKIIYWRLSQTYSGDNVRQLNISK